MEWEEIWLIGAPMKSTLQCFNPSKKLLVIFMSASSCVIFSFFFSDKRFIIISFRYLIKCKTLFTVVNQSIIIWFFLENLKPLLPAGIQNKLHTLVPCKKFDLSYDLNCHKLCSDFQEDIVFRFSLGWSSLVHRFLGPTNAQRVLLGLSEPIFQVSIYIYIYIFLFGRLLKKFSI